MKKYDVTFGTGTSRYGDGTVDYMLVSIPAEGMEDIGLEAELYAEEKPVPGDRTANFNALKAEILKMADEADIPHECLVFHRG